MFFTKKKKNVAYLRSIWGKAIDRHRNIDLIALYHNMLEHPVSEAVVENKTWEDLNLDSVFSKIDRNISGIGEQYLYHLLHKYEGDDNLLQKRFRLSEYFKTDNDLREEIQLNLFRLKETNSYFLPYIVLDCSIPFTKYYRFFYFSALLPLIFAALLPLSNAYVLGVIGGLLLNIILELIFSRKTHKYYSGFTNLTSLIASAISIGKIKPGINIDEIDLLRQRRGVLISLRKKLRTFTLDKEVLDELSRSFFEYLNCFFLLDIISYYRSVNILLKYQREMHDVYKAVASLDSSIAIASYLTEIDYYSTPEFNNSDSISFERMYHPCIPDAIPNTINDINKSVLITGSNMSGKTTFIKTIGVNTILAQTLYFSLAQSFNLPKLFVKTSIRRNEEMEEGKSYFWIEIEELKNFIELANSNNKYLFLIDEIFRGTNTIERLASSSAVLKYLNKKDKVFVTTHDIELQNLLENQFIMFHFSEQVEGDKYSFNYKIKNGPCTSGNAIKLLEIIGYPDIVTAEAKGIVKELLLEDHSLSGNKNVLEK